MNEKPKKSLLKRFKSEKNVGKKVRFLDLEKKKRRKHGNGWEKKTRFFLAS